jgi:hypothetical protein
MLFDWSTHFFYASLSIYLSLFSMTLSPFARMQEEKSLWNMEYLFLVGGWHVLRNSQCGS